MIHTEHLRKADESYEIRFNSNGDVTHAYFKDGYYIIFPTLDHFVRYVYLGEDVERTYLDEEDWDTLCKSDEYSYYKFS
jgi:hypothetical protein